MGDRKKCKINGVIEANKPVVLALANALIDHPLRTLNSVEIDQCIAGRAPSRSVEGRS